jgi:hypothetical protein
MPNLTDSMNTMRDEPVEVSLRCAKCNCPVKSGAAHICNFYDSLSSSSDVSKFLSNKGRSKCDKKE